MFEFVKLLLFMILVLLKLFEILFNISILYYLLLLFIFIPIIPFLSKLYYNGVLAEVYATYFAALDGAPFAYFLTLLFPAIYGATIFLKLLPLTLP
jgi:hypothetical protein